MLAGGWRPLHHPAAGLLAQSRYRQAQLRHVSHAGLRRAHRRHALADPQAGRGALPPHADSRAQTRMDVAVAIGADPATMYSAILPLPPDLDEMMIAGFLRAEPGRDGEVPDRAIWRCPRMPRSCWKATWSLGELRHRRAIRRSHRLLLAGRRVPGLPRRPA